MHEQIVFCIHVYVCLFVCLCESSIGIWRSIAIKICFSELYSIHYTLYEMSSRLTYSIVYRKRSTQSLHFSFRDRDRERVTFNPFC